MHPKRRTLWACPLCLLGVNQQQRQTITKLLRAASTLLKECDVALFYVHVQGTPVMLTTISPRCCLYLRCPKKIQGWTLTPIGR